MSLTRALPIRRYSLISRSFDGVLALVALTLCSLSSLPSQAQTDIATLDFTGLAVYQANGVNNPVTRTLVVGPGFVDQIAFHFGVTHFSRSGSIPAASNSLETHITVIAPDGTRRTYVGGSADFNLSSNPNFAGTLSFGPAPAEGTWTFRFWDSLIDDVETNFVTRAGSTLTLQQAAQRVTLSQSNVTLTRDTA